MRKLKDIDFISDLKKSRKNSDNEYLVNEYVKTFIDNKWLTVEPANFLTGTHLIFNRNPNVKLYTVTRPLHNELYMVQFLVEGESLIGKALKKKHHKTIDGLIQHATMFNQEYYDGSFPFKIRLRLKPKEYLKFLNTLVKEIKNVLKENNIEASLENVALALSVTFMFNNFKKFFHVATTEQEILVSFFERFKEGLTPEVALITIVNKATLEESVQYKNMPVNWVEQVSDMDCDIFVN